MSGGIAMSSVQRLLFLIFVEISLQSIPGLADDPTNSKKVENSEANSRNLSNNKLKPLFICLGVAGVVFLSVILFKFWQKKKMEDQHARLLRLFEDDDELELELGLRK